MGEEGGGGATGKERPEREAGGHFCHRERREQGEVEPKRFSRKQEGREKMGGGRTAGLTTKYANGANGQPRKKGCSAGG